MFFASWLERQENGFSFKTAKGKMEVKDND